VLTITEPTYEGMCKLFAVGQPSLGLFSNEGGQFVGGHGMSTDNRLKTAAGLSDIWDGSAIRRSRAGEGTSVLPGRRLSMHLMMQPSVANVLFSDSLLANQGLFSRLLVTDPETTVGSRPWHDATEESDHALKRYGARLLGALEKPLCLAACKTNELDPRTLLLTANARRDWIAFSDHIEKEMAAGAAFESVRGMANKLPEHAARLAGVLTLVADIDAVEISAIDMHAGIALAEHYARETLRLFGMSEVREDTRLSDRLLTWLLTVWSEPNISLPDIYQKGPRPIREMATAKKLVAVLEEHGWLVRIHKGAIVAGVHREDAWTIQRRQS
jgi:hypothetical protein